MEEIRKAHNTFKKELIQLVTREGDLILDVGCGCGGDLQKWRHAGANINMCDPDETSLQEARTRAKNLKIRVNFIMEIFLIVQIENLIWFVLIFLFIIFLNLKKSFLNLFVK